MAEKDLKLAPENRTEALINGKRDQLVLDSIKYLGVVFDTRVSEKIINTVEQAEEKIAKIIRLISNIGRPSSSKRAVGRSFNAIVRSANLERSIEQKMQRKILIRVVGAYKKTPTPTLQVITRISNHAREKANVCMTKKTRQLQKTKKTGYLTRKTDTEQQTNLLIPCLKSWTECKYRRLDYYLTQILTDHGMF